MTTVTWVKDVNDFYEVSSPEHLIQIMHAGSKFTNAGTTPVFSNVSTKFLQTVDIDLANYHEHIQPVPSNWASTYDGGNHSISNWEYTEDHSETGFFRSLIGTFKNVRLTGVWKLIGDGNYRGFIAGIFTNATARIDNVRAEFEPGTELRSSCWEAGVFVGRAQLGAYMSGCILTGTVDIAPTVLQCGGLVGVSNKGNITYCGNFATFPNGIQCRGEQHDQGVCGGIVSRFTSGMTEFHNNINGMKGVVGNTRANSAGGIIGHYSTGDVPTRFDTLVNVMVGNIIGREDQWSGGIGGIIGYTSGNGALSITKLVNNMSGNIIGDIGTSPGVYIGGLIGRHDNSSASTISVTNSIVAMNGNVQGDAVTNFVKEPTNVTISATVNTDFGLTFDSNTYASTDALVDFVTDDTFTLLPYVPMVGTTTEGTAISFDPMFNLGGLDEAEPLSKYSTLTIHTSPMIEYPFYMNMGFSESNTTKYYTYAVVTPHKVTVYVDDAITGPFTISDSIDSVFNISETTLLKGLVWTQNVSNEYEVSTAAHLVQLMSKGTVFDDTGVFPSDYMTSNFVQTTDIDLSGKEAVIEPIGDGVNPFTGIYTGGSFTIDNWKYARPDDGTDPSIGLFGVVDGGSIRDVKMGGIWSMSGSCSAQGLLVGRLTGTSALVANVETDFENGTSITSGHATSSTCGLLIGVCDGDCEITGLSLRGSVSFKGSASILGGVLGSLSGGSSISWVENALTLTDGLGPFNTITTGVTGGIIGTLGPDALNAFHLSNNSTGNISGGKCGGIVGSCATGLMTRADTWANAMTGNIVGSTCAGGAVGEFEALSSEITAITKVTNYMSGNITSSASGGIIGKTVDSSSGAAPAFQCTNCIVAMKGTVVDTAVGQAGHPVAMAINVNADFGLVFTTNTHVTTDALTGYESFTGFPLPFLSMTGTTHDREILFPNLGGVANTSPLFGYSAAVIHASTSMYQPFRTEFDFIPDGTKYISYAKTTDSELYVDPSLTVVSSTALYVMDHNNMSKLGFLPQIQNTKTKSDMQSVEYSRKHSWTHFTDQYIIGVHDQNSMGAYDSVNVATIGSWQAGGIDNLSWVRPLGCVFNMAEQTLYYVNNDTKRLAKKKIDTSNIVDVYSDATYYNIAGDVTNVYMFGSRNFGGVHQVFRVDSDGTNMNTVDVSDLIGINTEVNNFTSNADDERIYFSDHVTGVLYSLSWELDDIQTMPFRLRRQTGSQSRNSIYYHQGMIYYANVNPITGKDDSYVYAYDIVRNGHRNIFIDPGLDINGHVRGRNYIYVDAATKRLLISSTYLGTSTYVGTNFDFSTQYISETKKYTDGYTISWPPMEGATSYQVSVNGVLGTTTETTYTTRGHADGTYLDVKLFYSTDDVTYVKYRYAYRGLNVQAKFSELLSTPVGPWNGSLTWVDPYNPTKMIFSNGNAIIFDVTNRTIVANRGLGVQIKMFRRSFTTKEILGVNSNKFYNFGENAKHIVEGTVPPLPAPFYTHPEPILYFDCSYTGLIYFIAQTSNEIWTVNVDGTNAQLLFALNGTGSSLATDPYDRTTLVYADGDALMYRNLSTGASRVVLPSKMSLNYGMTVLNDVIYTTYRWQNEGYIRVNIDGVSDYFQGIRSWGVGTLVDTVNQVVYDFTIGQYSIYHDSTYTIASLPADPSSMIVAVNPLGMRATWSPISGATSYKIGISSGSDGENPITVYYTTSDISALGYTHTLATNATVTVYLKYDTLTETDLLSSSRTITIPAMSTDSSAFSKDFFRGKDGKFDITKIKVDLGNVMNDIFESGDDIQVKLPGGKEVKTTFVKRGGTVPISNDASIAIPFSKDAGGGQSVSITLSDSSSLVVAFDETTESLSVGGVSYSSGDSFVIDGKKVTIVDV